MKQYTYLFASMLLFYLLLTHGMEHDICLNDKKPDLLPLPYIHNQSPVRNAIDEIAEWASADDPHQAMAPKPNNPLSCSAKEEKKEEKNDSRPSHLLGQTPTILNCGMGYRALRLIAMNSFYRSNAFLGMSDRLTVGQSANIILTAEIIYMLEDINCNKLKINIDNFNETFAKNILPNYCNTLKEFIKNHEILLNQKDYQTCIQGCKNIGSTIYRTYEISFEPMSLEQECAFENILIKTYYLMNSSLPKLKSNLKKLNKKINVCRSTLPEALSNNLNKIQTKLTNILPEIKPNNDIDDELLTKIIYPLFDTLDACAYQLFTRSPSSGEQKNEIRLTENDKPIIKLTEQTIWQKTLNIAQRCLLLGLAGYLVFINKHHFFKAIYH